MRQGWNEDAHGHLRKPVERERVCKQCGGPFTQKSRGRILGTKYCSRPCQRAALTARAISRLERRPRLCPNCQTPFTAKQWTGKSWQKFCGPKCWSEHQRKNAFTEVACANCGKKFMKRTAYVKRSEWHACSTECRHKFYRGEEHAQWRGVKQPYGQAWRGIAAQARARDEHTCRRCGKQHQEGQPAFPVDHIRPLRSFEKVEDAHALTNLATLCPECHSHKTTVIEARWLRGDVQPFEQFLKDIAVAST